uniref:Uncharacterized protein n=1 Tax=Cacopsylla melanoneura TaxID=428564 RepID=A0A8D8W196_9HEMI
MNANDLISADLLPRNVPKPSSFHENTLKPEVPEVSLMFDNGFQYSKSNDNREKSVKSSMKLSEGLRDRRCGSPIMSEAVQELLQKNNKQFVTPNKQKSKPSTPNKNKQVERPNSLKSSSDELDNERQNGVDNNRHINSENHLIEPVESYSVWKYKNQHMFNREEVNRKDIENHSENGQNDEHREIRSNNRYKPNYEQQQAGLRYQNLPYEQDDLQYPRADPMKYVQEYPNSIDLVRNKNEQFRIENEYVETRRPTGKPSWRNASPMSQEPLHSAVRYNEPVPCQTRRPEGNNSVNELCKIVEFQTKHIEFLNEQIYNLTLQNKSFSNVKQQLKTLEDTQTETMDFMKRNFDKINDALQSIGSANKESKPANSIKNSPCKKSDLAESEKAENTLEKMEKKLIDLINNKLNSKPSPEPTETLHRNKNQNFVEEEEEGDTSSSEYSPVDKQDKQCACACDKKQVQVSSKSKQREFGVKKSQKHTNEIENRVHTKCPTGYQTDMMKYNAQVMNHWESPPGPSKQVANSKPAKKSQRKSNQMEQIVNPQSMPKLGPSQPLLYYQQPVYQQEKIVQSNKRMSNEGKPKKDKIKNSPDEKYGTRGRKGKPKGPAHYSKNNGAPAFRLESNLMNEENSLTLNARELPVINEHIPSPEASVHIDMGEYQSSDNESDQDSDQTGNREVSEESNDEPEDEAVPWPTFYNNVVGKVHKLLQGGHQAPVEQADDIPDDQYRTVQVRMATIDQFKKMGISFVDDSPNSKRVTFNNKNKNPKHEPPHYENYRPSDGSSKRAPLTAVCNTNLSFASLQYLQRYHLLPNVQTQDLFHPNNEMNHED